MPEKKTNYVDRLIAEMAPKEDTFDVHIVDKEGDVVNFPPVTFTVVRDYDNLESVAKSAGKFVQKYRGKKLTPDVMKHMNEVSESFSDEVLITAFTLSHYVVDKETWDIFQFLRLAKNLAWVFVHLDQGFRSHQMKALPEKDLAQFDDLKKVL